MIMKDLFKSGNFYLIPRRMCITPELCVTSDYVMNMNLEIKSVSFFRKWHLFLQALQNSG